MRKGREQWIVRKRQEERRERDRKLSFEGRRSKRLVNENLRHLRWK